MGNTRPLTQQSAPPGKRPRAGRGRRFLKLAAIAFVAAIVVLALAVGIVWIVTPSASEAPRIAAAQAKQHGIAYPGPDVPENFARPLIATEDHRFYSEPGIDPFAVARVAWAKVTDGGDQGGATIEQQLAKMLYTPGQKGFKAEIEQVALAVKLNLTYSKQRILNLYAQVAYYGHGYYGLQRASCGYFGHPAKDLTVFQGALLAGVVNAPSRDNPVTHPGNARARLAHVLTRMEAVGYLTSAQARQVLNAPLGLTRGGNPCH